MLRFHANAKSRKEAKAAQVEAAFIRCYDAFKWLLSLYLLSLVRVSFREERGIPAKLKSPKPSERQFNAQLDRTTRLLTHHHECTRGRMEARNALRAALISPPSPAKGGRREWGTRVR